MKFNRKSRFTLIELLVVIAIIGILAAIILPDVAKVRHQGKVWRQKKKREKFSLL